MLVNPSGVTCYRSNGNGGPNWSLPLVLFKKKKLGGVTVCASCGDITWE